MKEVIALIRVNMMNKTKDALLAAGVPAFFASEALGRGKGLKPAETAQEEGEGPLTATLRVTESQLESGRLFAKRMVTVAVADSMVDEVVKAIIAVNQTGHPGDGKIFVMDLGDAVRVRTSESGNCAINY